MRTMKASASLLVAVVATLAIDVSMARAQEGFDPYPATMHYGTGLINTPVAWVSPQSGDGWFNISGKRIQYYGPADATFATQFNTNVSLDTHWMGRFSVGVSAYSQNPEWGFFGQAMLLKDNQVSFLPGIAVGVRNLGPYEHEDRFLIGHDIKLDSATQEYVEVVRDSAFETSPTFYAVATKDFALSAMNARLPATRMSLSVGYGNGLFKDDGSSNDAGGEQSYNDRGTLASGLFLGARVVMHPTLNSSLTLLGENDAWDWNAGVVYNWRGLSAALYGTELEEGGRSGDDSFQVYNYRKINFALGYSGNIFDIARGVILRTRITDLTREQQRLRMDIAARNRRIAGLEVTLRRAQAGELSDIARRRAELESQINEDREAIRRATERLNDLERGRTTTPPPSSPPPSSPPPPLSSDSSPPSL